MALPTTNDQIVAFFKRLAGSSALPHADGLAFLEPCRRQNDLEPHGFCQKFDFHRRIPAPDSLHGIRFSFDTTPER
jgi:hypothetical protein